jgi:methionyl-tRNA formyltransferase
MRFQSSCESWVVLYGGGEKRFASLAALRDSGVKVVAVFLPTPSSDGLRARVGELFRGQTVSMIVSSASELDTDLSAFEASGILCIGWPSLLTRERLDIHPLAINVHPTLLPKYKGPNSGAYVILNGEDYSGSTIHIMEANVDSGAILAQNRVDLTPFDTVTSVQRKVYAEEPALLADTLSRLSDGLDVVEQKVGEGSTYPRRRPSDSMIDPTRPLIDLMVEIRASNPDTFPAYFNYMGERVAVHVRRLEKGDDEHDMI